MSSNPPLGRVIKVTAVGLGHQKLAGTLFKWTVDGVPGGEAIGTEGHTTFTIADVNKKVGVSATHNGITKQVELANDAKTFEFTFDVPGVKPDANVQYLAIGAGLVVMLLGVGGAFLMPCLRPGQAFAVVVTLAVGAAVMLFGFLQRFDLSVTQGAITASGAGAVFVVIFLVRPSVLPLIECKDSLFVTIRAVDVSDRGVPKARVTIRDPRRPSTLLETDAQGEAQFEFGDLQLGHEVVVIASSGNLSGSTKAKLTTNMPALTVKMLQTGVVHYSDVAVDLPANLRFDEAARRIADAHVNFQGCSSTLLSSPVHGGLLNGRVDDLLRGLPHRLVSGTAGAVTISRPQDDIYEVRCAN